MGRTVRSSVSIPVELKARMDEVGDGVNWSTVACRAFEQHVAELIKQRGAKNVEDVVARLRASKVKARAADYQAGHKAGKEWAEGQAEAAELERLESALKSGGDDELLRNWNTGGYSSHWSVCEAFYFMVKGTADGEEDSRAAAFFWCVLLGDDQENQSNEFVQGFADGALEVWDAVKDQL